MEIKFNFINLFLEQIDLNKKENCPDGFYENLYKTKKYSSLKEAIDNKDYVTVSTGKNEENLLSYHLCYHLNKKEQVIVFANQDPRFGEDAFDNQNMLKQANKMLN